MTDADIQDLKRENFNLKLRIYFLEEQGQVNVSNVSTEYQTSSAYVQQLQNEIEGLRRRLPSQSDQSTSNFDFHDERRALREELEQCRRALQRATAERTQLTASSVDSGVDAQPLGMSSAFLSNSALQSEERERKLEENLKSLQKQLESSIGLTNETLAELERARRKIKHYESEIENYEQRQSKAERVLHRLQVEYESRIAHLVEQQQQRTTDFETYRHEPLLARIRLSYPLHESGSSNVNIDEYRQAIENRDRIIQQLEESINEMTARIRTPFNFQLPSDSSASQWTDERSQALIQELNTQLKIHLETIDQLRAECLELRRGEIHLRHQVDSLTHLINTPNRATEFSRQPTKTTPDPIQTAERIEDLQTAVVQITLQLQTDAENVSGLTNRVAQIIRDRDEWQEKINRLHEEIEEKNAHIRQLEQREPQVEIRLRQQFTMQLEALQREIQSLKNQLQDKEEVHSKTRKDYEQFDTVQNQERENLQNQLRIASERLINCEQDLADERKRFEDLQRKYETIRTSSSSQVEQFEMEIQQQRIYIEEFNQRIRESEKQFQSDRQQIERERDFEKQKSLDREHDFQRIQREYNRLQITLEEQKQKFDEQFRDQDRANGDLANLRRENQSLRDQLRDLENRLVEVNRVNNEFKSQVSVYEVRFQDNEDLDRRNRNEISQLQRENEDRIDEINEWKRRYESIERVQSENTKLQQEIHELSREQSKLTEYNTQLQHEYQQYRIEQETNYDTLQHSVDDAAERNLTAFEERVRLVSENKQKLIDQLEHELREKETTIKDLRNARSRDLQLDLEIRIEQLKQEVEVKETFIRTYSETVEDKEQQIRQLLDSIQQGDTDKTVFIDQLREDLRDRDERIDRLTEEYERRLRERQRDLDEFNERYRIQQRELEDYRQKSDITKVDLNIALEENEAHLERIQFLEKQFQMSQARHSPTEQISHYETIISDLKSKLRQRDDSIQLRQHRLDTLRDLQRTVAEPSTGDLQRYEQMEKQLTIELEKREQTIAALRKKLAEKEEEIQKLRSRSRESDTDSKSEYTATRAPANVALKLEIQKKDEEIARLQRELDKSRGESSSSIEHARPAVIDRPSSRRFEHLTREELLSQLELALQDNEGLVQQLAKKTPNITELHHQLLDLRKELARQKYVNQVLWRKLDALIDIQGSNTRAELAIELANYHEELEALKAKQHRAQETRTGVLNALSRSSSGLTNPSPYRSQVMESHQLEDLVINLDISFIPANEPVKQTSLNKKDSGVESVIESTRYTFTQQQLSEKDEQIRKLTKQLADMQRAYETELTQYRLKAEKIQTDLIGDLDGKQNDLRQVRLQVDLLKSTKTQLDQAQDQNQRLQNELANKTDLLTHYEKQINLLEKQISSRGTGEMTVRTSEMSELLEEMRRLRHDLQQSLIKQEELQVKLDENLRISRTPREFTFSGRGTSYPDLRVVETEFTGSKIVRATTTTVEAESTYPTKMYYIGEIDTHELVRRLIADLKIEIKALEVKLKEKLRSKFTSALSEPSIEWLEHRLKTVTLCLNRLEETSQLIESYWKGNLPLKNSSNEHPCNDPRLLAENHELKSSQTRYIQELQSLRQRYKEQSAYMDQVLAQLTRANHKKANSDDYLALLLRPTLDVLQKARSNMENHLKDSPINKNFLSESFQSSRRPRLNRLD